MQNVIRRCALTLFLAVCSLCAIGQDKPKKLDSIDADRIHAMLKTAYAELKSNYYDKTFHGIDMEARLKEYDAKVSTVGSLGEGFRIVAAYLSVLKDSHVFFLPPARAVRMDNGYKMQMIGDACIVTQVKPQTEVAEKLHPGDRILKLNGFTVGRQDLWDIEYYFNVLAPSPSQKLSVRDVQGVARDFTLNATVKQLKRSLDTENRTDMLDLTLGREDSEDLFTDRVLETPEVMYWKMSQFQASDLVVQGIYGRAAKHPALVIDLRGNPGGAIDTLQWALGGLFDHDVKISDRVGRKEMKPQVAKASRTPYKGKVIVLIDSGSASSSELFARVVQLEKRGTVLGDVSAGAVMEARRYEDNIGSGSMIFYGFEITDANLIMKDGKSIEGVGVTPDEISLPTRQEVADGVDPVLARAAELAGGKLTPADAGKMFPFVWRKL